MLIGSIPPTGLPLPFISAGSTSLLVFMSAIGVVLNIDKKNSKNSINVDKNTDSKINVDKNSKIKI